MKRLVVVSFILSFTQLFSQTLLLNENFDYIEGELPTVSSNWSEDPAGSYVINVITGSLPYLGYESSDIGNKIFIDGGATGRSGVSTIFSSQSGDGSKLYISFLLNVKSSSIFSADTIGEYFFNFNHTSGSQIRGCIVFRAGTNLSNFQLGIGKTTTSSNWVYSNLDLNLNETYLLVIGYVFQAGGDDIKLWINPDLSGTEPTPDITNSNGSDASDIDEIQLRQQEFSGDEEIDGLRIATDWTLAPLPVELSSFTASVRNSSVRLNWRTETEVMNYGFEVERALSINNSSDQIHYGKIGFVPGNGNSNKPHDYKFWDKRLEIPGRYFYRLKQIDNDGNFEYSNPVEVLYSDDIGYRLKQNYPNPFNPVTKIEYIIPEKSFVTIKVYDILGNEVKTLVSNNLSAGSYSVNFEPGNLPSGFYTYSISAGNFKEVKKMLYLK
jgi:hypothetical protein